MRIITLSREFGSGGRELGKRLADYLNFAYYDKEILSTVAERGCMDEEYVQRMLEIGINRSFPIKFGRTLSLRHQQPAINLMLMQQEALKELAAKGDCIIVGRGANSVLQDYRPFNLFVYADMEAKIRRCQNYADIREDMTEKELRAKMRQVDNGRRNYYTLCSGGQWGQKEDYHLCINTADITIKAIAPAIGEYARLYFMRDEK